MTIRAGSLAALACVTVALSAGAAFGQDAAALAARRGLIEQAQAARVANNHQEALTLAERASRLQMSPSLRLFIAQEQNALGRLAESYGNADLCMREAEADTNLRNRDQVAATCRSLSQELRGRVGRVTVTVPTPTPAGLQVTVAGNTLTDALWGVPYVVTPGHVVIEASANGYASFHREVDVAAGGTSPVSIEMAQQAGGTAHTSAAQSSSSPAPHGASSPAPAASGGGPSIGGIALVIGGVLLLGVGGVFLYLWSSDLSQAQSATLGCPMYDCSVFHDPADHAARVAFAQNHINDSTTWEILGPVVGGVGLIAAVVGVVLIVTSGHSTPARAAGLHLVPLRDGGAILGLHGTF